jgi:Cft2 family RNA processing exonuclease
MKLTFLGGADEVGASCTLIEIAGKRLLVDAGIRISPKTSRGIQNSQLPDLQPISAIGGIDYLLVTHAHTDHTGALPLVVGHYPHIPVIMTRPTEMLVRILQKDAQRIMQGNYDEEGELPLFDEVAVERLLNTTQIIEFNQSLKLGEDLQITYYVSGHIAGAGMIVIESSDGTLVMSGDVSKSPQRTVEAVQVPKIKADALVLESTYGGRMHANREAEERRLIETLIQVTERGGKVLIPAFALGRAQEVLQIILAYRDRMTAPVYVDGMVRSVCEGYSVFRDLLPRQTVRAAGDESLFFRQGIQRVKTTQQRNDIAMSSTPCVIVASSGMLTGGASQVYAKTIAPNPLDAILLTGYQDEESPGKALQKLMKDRENDIPTFRLGKDTVAVQCQLNTYSLSAHADEDELVSIAQAFQAGEVMLVHGDAAARHSLATALRQRQIIVTSPKIGTTRELKFKKKAWGIGTKVTQGSHTGDVDLEQLWLSIKDRAGNYFSARELSQVWYGTSDHADDILLALNHSENIYFAADWRIRNTFMVKTEQQVKRTLRQRAILLANPDLVGKLVVLRNSNNQPRLGVVKSADIDSFEADVQDAKGSRYPGDALLWVIGRWDGIEGGEGSTKTQLNALLKNAKAITDSVLPFALRQELVTFGEAILPESLIPADLPEGINQQTALAAIVLALAADGAVLEQDGLKPQRALEHGPMEMNEAQAVAKALFPADARLRKVGMEVNRKRIVLSFDFPQSVERQYSDLIVAVEERTGWEVQVRPIVNQNALAVALNEILPEGVRISKGPSFFLDKREVAVELEGLEDSDELEGKFMDMTDFKLIVNKQKRQYIQMSLAAGQTQMEINNAYGVIRRALEPVGLYKTSLKGGQIVLTFISPQVGERHHAKIQDLAKQTGYTLTLHPHPNQQQISMIASQMANDAGWQVRKGPSIHVERAEVTFALNEAADAEAVAAIAAEFKERTGYSLIVL